MRRVRIRALKAQAEHVLADAHALEKKAGVTLDQGQETLAEIRKLVSLAAAFTVAASEFMEDLADGIEFQTKGGVLWKGEDLPLSVGFKVMMDPKADAPPKV